MVIKKSIKGMVLVALAFLCLGMVGSVSATDGTTFPVDDAGIAAYVKVSDSIDLHSVMDTLLPDIADIIKTDPTYFIVNITNDDNQITHLYVGADGWIIPYYLPNECVSKIVRWNITSSEPPTPEEVVGMTTLEEVIYKTCIASGVNYETIRSDIKFYDFEHPDANRMMLVVDIRSEGTLDSFYVAIPSEVTVNESSFSLASFSGMTCGMCLTYYHTGFGTGCTGGNCAVYRNAGLPLNEKVMVTLPSSSGACPDTGVGWVLIYQTY